MSRGDRVPWTLGLELPAIPDLQEALTAALEESYDFVVAPLVHPKFERTESAEASSGSLVSPLPTSAQPLTRSDVLLTSSEWSSSVVGRVSDWVIDQLTSRLSNPSQAAQARTVRFLIVLGLSLVFSSTNLGRFLFVYFDSRAVIQTGNGMGISCESLGGLDSTAADDGRRRASRPTVV